MTIKPIIRVNCPFSTEQLIIDMDYPCDTKSYQVPRSLVYLELHPEGGYEHPQFMGSGKAYKKVVLDIIQKDIVPKSNVVVVYIHNNRAVDEQMMSRMVGNPSDETYEQELINGWALFSSEPEKLVQEILAISE